MNSFDLPQFKYSPNAYKLDLFEEIEGQCSICNESRNIKYVNSFYSEEEPEYICPWCIENGKAAEKYSGTFNSQVEIQNLSPQAIIEITTKTPSYTSWQQEVWLSHCNEPCAFIDYADIETIKSIYEELKEDIEINIGIDPEIIKISLSKNGSLVGYLFQCLKCKKHRLYADSD